MKPSATIRAELGDFVVDEIPSYLPAGQGPHAFLHVRKHGLTTFECIARIARATGIPPRDIGHAGLKDRHAVTSQYLSLPWAETVDIAPLRHLALEGIDILDVARHGNKLRVGHLTANRFRIVLRNLPPGSLQSVRHDLEAIAPRGFPNAFGPQRFGRDGNNPDRTLAWLRGQERGPRDPKLAKLLFSSVQSLLFDHVLQARVENDTWHSVIDGDIAKKHDTGGLFDCTDPAVDAERASRGEISATGPIFGADMRRPSGRADELERSVLSAVLGDDKILQRYRKLGAGSRRILRVFPSDLAVTEGPDHTLVAQFTLPKGVYATTLLGLACSLRDASSPSRETNTPQETSVHDELLYDSRPTSE